MQSGARAAHRRRHRLDRLLLPHHALGDLRLHAQELVALAFEHLVDLDAGPARHHLRDQVRRHHLLRHGAAFGLVLLQLFQLGFEIGDDAVSELSGACEIAAALRLVELDAGGVELLFQLLRAGELGFLLLPALRQRARLLLEIGELLLELGQPVLGRAVLFLLQRLALDLELHDAPVELVERLGLGVDLHPQPRRGLIDQVDRLVGQEAVGDVAVRQHRRGDQRGIGDAHAVMQLVFLFQPAQDRDGVLDARLRHVDRLEAPG